MRITRRVGATQAGAGARRRRWRAAGAYGGLVAALGVLVGFGMTSIFSSGSQPTSATRTVTASAGTVQLLETATGNVAPAETATMNFPVAGTLRSLDVHVGEQVTSGEPLASIDATQATDSVDQAKAALLGAQQTLSTDEGGPTASTKASDAANLVGAQSSVASAEENLQSDEATLHADQATLASLRAAGCPAASSGATGGTGTGSTGTSASSSNGSSSSGTSTSSGSTGSGSAGTGASGSGSASTGGSGATSGSAGTGISGSGADGTGSSTGATGRGSSSSLSVALDPSGASGAVRLTSATVSALPVVSTASASASTTTATLEGTVNPEGGDTSYFFQYGTTTAYGQRTPVESAGNGTSATSVTASIRGLKADTVYVFRLVAASPSGTVVASPATFTTAQSSCASEAQVVTSQGQTVARAKQSVVQAKDSLTSTVDADATNGQASAATIAQDEATLAQDEATLAEDQTNLSQTTLRSPIAGTVTSVSGEVGQAVSAGTSTTASATSSSSSSSSSGSGLSSGSGSSGSSSGVVVVEDLRSMDVVVDFPEADIGDLAAGDAATVTFPALTGVSVTGKVQAIAPTSTLSSNVVEYPVTVALDGPSSQVRDGMTADISVVAKSASNVLEVPSEAVTTVGSRSTVTVLRNGVQTTKTVTVGIVGSSTTEITSGLQSGETVVLPSVSVASGTSGTTSTGRGGFGGGGGIFGGGGGGGFRASFGG